MRGITIGQLAKYAGVTIKAVRHYHKRGLLKEPVRDASGYRRYNATDAIELVKIKTLADAGVPLARVKELLAASPGQFAAAMAEIDRKLQDRLDALILIRQQITQLSSGDRLFVSVEVADYLDYLREIGVSQRSVQLERDLWILVQSISPREAGIIIDDKRETIKDPEFQSIYLAYDAAIDWSPDDARLIALANRSKQWFANQPNKSKSSDKVILDPTIIQLVATSFSGISPAWDRLAELAKERQVGA
jgi:DNA-binding transcriptional MerR regulator